MIPVLLDKRLILVTGKGGVGKTTVAAALALASARAGQRTLVCEINARERIAALLGRPETGAQITSLEENLWGVDVRPHEAMREYALMILKFESIYNAVFENRLVRYFLRFVPSLQELVMLGKILFHLKEKRPDGSWRFDRIIIDAPSTGHAITFFSVPKVILDTVPPGALAADAKWMRECLIDPAITAAVLVSLPEEMPVNETIELAAALKDRVQIQPQAIVLNAFIPARFSPADVEQLPEGPMRQVAAAHRGRSQMSISAADRLETLKYPLYVVPRQFGTPFGRAAIEDVSRALGGEVNAIAAAVKKSNVVVAVGPGGVGKTTVAATIALRAAIEGKGSLVCTIDPAKRLANALGLAELGNAELRIADPILAQAAGQPPRAPMHAMMLDMKRAWDDLIEQRAPPDKREKILSNRFYQSLSSALAGSQEYIAMEKLCELRMARNYPLIVLDTPPTAHALDFLDAPNRILDFLDNDAAKWLLTPALAAGKIGLKLFNLGSSYVAKTISKFTGAETLQELANFMLHMSSMYEGFRERAHQTQALLEADTTSFVLVTAPMPERLDEAVFFHTTLLQNHLTIASVVVNRVHPPVPSALWAEAKRLPDELRKRVEATLNENDHLASQDARGIARLAELCGPTPLTLIPRFELDVHDLSSLWNTSRFLFGEARLEPAQPAR